MSDQDLPTGKDETEPVCEPIIRLQATVKGKKGKTMPNANHDYDQTEPSDIAHLIQLPPE